MTIELTPELSRQQYYDRAFQWIEPGMEDVTSADKFYTLMRDTGLYIPRSIAREVWKAHGEAVGWKPLLERQPPNWKIPKRWTPEVEYTKEGKYLARVTVWGYSPLKDKEITRKPLIALDEQGTMRDIMLGGEDVMRDSPPEDDFIVYGMEFETYYHIKGREW